MARRDTSPPKSVGVFTITEEEGSIIHIELTIGLATVDEEEEGEDGRVVGSDEAEIRVWEFWIRSNWIQVALVAVLSSNCEIVFSCAESVAKINELYFLVSENRICRQWGKTDLLPQGFVEAVVVSEECIGAGQTRVTCLKVRSISEGCTWTTGRLTLDFNSWGTEAIKSRFAIRNFSSEMAVASNAHEVGDGISANDESCIS
jgi:hypothetical protein